MMDTVEDKTEMVYSSDIHDIINDILYDKLALF